MGYEIPRLKDENAFENLVRDIFAERFSNDNLQRYGRSGQNQHGIDIIGKDNRDGKQKVIQCKNHPQATRISAKKTIEELETDLLKFDKSAITASEFTFVTTVNSDATIIDKVAEISGTREINHKCKVHVMFWPDIESELVKGTNLLRRYFPKLFIKSEDFHLFGTKGFKKTIKLSYKDLIGENIEEVESQVLLNIEETLDGVDFDEFESKYALSIGFYSNGSGHQNTTDVDIDLGELMSDEKNADANFLKIATVVDNLLTLVKCSNRLSNEIIVHLETQISTSFLIGFIFRKHRMISHLVFNDLIFTTKESVLEYYPSQLERKPPIRLNPVGNERLIVYTCTPTHTYDSERKKVVTLANKLGQEIQSIDGFTSPQILNSAHASSVAKDIAKEINFSNNLEVDIVHLVLMTPKPLAALIGYHLNTLNIKIKLYFLDSERKNYLCAGEISNNLLREI